MEKNVLNLLIQQYQKRRNRLPDEIVVHPVALAALALKESVASVWQGIPVKCREIKPVANPTGLKLGVTVLKGALRGFDL